MRAGSIVTILMTSLDATVGCRGWMHDHLVAAGQPYWLSVIRMGVPTHQHSAIAHGDTDTYIASVFFYYSNSFITGVSYLAMITRSWVQSFLSHIFIAPCIMCLSRWRWFCMNGFLLFYLFSLYYIIYHISYIMSLCLSLALVLYESTSPFIFILYTALWLTAHPPHDQSYYPTQHGKAYLECYFCFWA